MIGVLREPDQSFYEKYKWQIYTGGFIGVVCIVIIILWAIGVFDRSSSADITNGPLQFVEFTGVEMTSVYTENTDNYSINWPIGSLQYKDPKGNVVLFPQVNSISDGPAQIPTTIPVVAGNYGPYATKSNIIITTNLYKAGMGIVKNYTYPAGSVFAFKVDEQFNITYLWHLSVEASEEYIKNLADNPANESDQATKTLVIKANPANLRNVTGNVQFFI